MTADQPRADAIAAGPDAREAFIRRIVALTPGNFTDDFLFLLDRLDEARAAMTTPREDAIAALAGHPSPDRGSGPWVLRLVCCGYDDGIERYATWDEADMFRQTYVTGPGGHDRAAILTRDLDTTYHRRRVARRLAALDAVEEPR